MLMSSKNISLVSKKAIFIALLILLSFNSTGCQDHTDSWQLVVKEPGSLTELYAIEAAPGSTFELSYRHSVSASMVYGKFKISEQGMIVPLTTSYSSFGPGLPLDYAEEYTIENGVITVYHRDEPREAIRLWVSDITGETIIINDLEYPLYPETSGHRLVEIYLQQ